MEGAIKKITDRGYGFIGQEGEDKDLFFHANSLADGDFDSLQEGDKVTFEIEDSDKGPRAVNIEKAE